MLLISICTILMVIGFLVASPNQHYIELDNGEYRRILTKQHAVYLVAVLVIVSTLRYGFVDTYAYKEMYRLSRNNWGYIFTGAGWGIETGWLFLNYILNFISASPKLILFLSALIINLAYYKIFQRYSEDACLSFFLYFCLMYLDTNNGTRQMVASAIVILAFPLLERKRYIAFLLFVFLAYLMHNSAIVWVLILFACFGEPLNIRTKSALAIGILFLFAPGLVTGIIQSTLEESQYSSYLELRGGMKFARAVVTGIIPGILAIIYHSRKKRAGYVFDRAEGMLLDIVIINTMFVLMGTYMAYWNRFAFYTLFATFVMIPKLAREVFGVYSYNKVIKHLMIILYFAYFCYNIFSNSGLPGSSSDSLLQFYVEWWC